MGGYELNSLLLTDSFHVTGYWPMETNRIRKERLEPFFLLKVSKPLKESYKHNI